MFACVNGVRQRPVGGGAARSAPVYVSPVEVLRAAGVFAVRDGEPNQYREHVRSPDLSVGTYCIPVGGKDGQHPHAEDEVYLVARGRATLRCEDGEHQVGPGSVVYVPAGERHQFVDVSEDLSIVVVFSPPEGARG
ncbi:MAG: cupin domain-containing protein [Pseudonocardia sp.]|nr:cupin domain-containing protein [Pseudonocardia sp.]